MSSSTASDSLVARGKLLRQEQGKIVLAVPGTDYQIHLAVSQPVQPDALGQICGRITARARRVDRVVTGGRFIEPSWGRPRILQGVIVATDPSANTITVRCAVPFECELTDPRQKAADFAIGELVNFSVERGARFEAAV